MKPRLFKKKIHQSCGIKANLPSVSRPREPQNTATLTAPITKSIFPIMGFVNI